MARAINRLKDITVRRVTKPGLYPDGAGLYLRVGPTGAKAWVFRYRQNGSRHDVGLGPLHTVSLAAARQRAQRCREQRLDGVDPLAARKDARTAARIEMATMMSFRVCAEAYIAAHQAGWRNPKHRAQWPATLATYAYPVFGELPVQAIDTGLVLRAIEPIWTTKPETASRLRGRIESVIGWAATKGYRQPGENPARWKDHLENLLPAKSKVRRVEHHAALPYAEIARFMAELRKQEGVGAQALEFAILTAARTGEVIGARWDEINLAERLWVVPADRMKAGKEHRVPLSDPAMAIVEAIGALRQGDFIFPGGKARRPLSNMALLMTLRRMGRDDLTAHGFRSSFSDWCAERTAYPSEVREMALAHAVGDKVEAAYRRGDLFEKRRDLADAWAAYCAGSVGGMVVQLRTSASVS
jgi:integrase